MSQRKRKSAWIRKFKNKAYAANFLTKALEISEPENLQFILLDVVKANGGYRQVADENGMNEWGLKLMLWNEEEYWKFLRLARLLKSMGLEITLTPTEKK
jgi:DNA-binding phage protein